MRAVGEKKEGRGLDGYMQNRALILQANQERRQGQINAERQGPAHAGSRSHAKLSHAAVVLPTPSLQHPSIKRCTGSLSAWKLHL